VKALREKIVSALASTETANRRLFLFVFVFAVTVGAILVSLNSAKPYESSTEPVTIEEPSELIEESNVFVHVVGEVEKPGIYTVALGGRVFDAIVAAGGFTNSADQSTVNLAREVSDGEQVVVLAALPGVGPTLAGRMVDWRTANGGFKKIEDLLKVSGIGSKMFDGIRSLVTL
jgi:competence protein ComEA